MQNIRSLFVYTQNLELTVTICPRILHQGVELGPLGTKQERSQVVLSLHLVLERYSYIQKCSSIEWHTLL